MYNKEIKLILMNQCDLTPMSGRTDARTIRFEERVRLLRFKNLWLFFCELGYTCVFMYRGYFADYTNEIKY